MTGDTLRLEAIGLELPWKGAIVNACELYAVSVLEHAFSLTIFVAVKDGELHEVIARTPNEVAFCAGTSLDEALAEARAQLGTEWNALMRVLNDFRIEPEKAVA